MTDTDRDPHPDSLPGDNHDVHSDLERGIASRNPDIENVQETADETPPEGADGGVGGIGGVTKNQDYPA